VRTRTEAIETAAVLEEAVARLRRADPGLRAVILFGSAAWAEEMARDLDPGEYPKEQAVEAFRLWKEEIQRFIERLLPR
jgi:hypothetical protein